MSQCLCVCTRHSICAVVRRLLMLRVKTTQNLWHHQHLWTHLVMTSRHLHLPLVLASHLAMCHWTRRCQHQWQQHRQWPCGLHALHVLTESLRSVTYVGPDPAVKKSSPSPRSLPTSVVRSDIRGLASHFSYFRARRYLLIFRQLFHATWPLPSVGTWQSTSVVDVLDVRLLTATRRYTSGSGWFKTTASHCKLVHIHFQLWGSVILFPSVLWHCWF